MLRREWPLAAFTLLAQTAVGLFLVFALPLALSRGTPAGDAAPVRLRILLAALMILAAGVAFSFFHLGNPRNAPRALANLKTSWLSREILSEIVFAGILAALVGLEAAGRGGGRFAAWLYPIGGLAGIVLVLSMANIYRLKTVPAWNRAATPVFFFLTTLTVGFAGSLAFTETGVLQYAAVDFPFPGALKTGALVLTIVSFGASVAFDASFGIVGGRPLPPASRPSPLPRALFAVRLGFLVLGIAILASSSGARPALAAVMVAEAAGRALFYASFRKAGL